MIFSLHPDDDHNCLASVITDNLSDAFFPTNMYLFKFNKWPRSGEFTINFEHISHFFLVFLLLTLNK